MASQLSILRDHPEPKPAPEAGRKGTFTDNMALPIHRWFRYSAGFSAQWVEHVIKSWAIKPSQLILDPFAGSGTVSLTCDELGIESVGVEAHPFIARIARAKLGWEANPARFSHLAQQVLDKAQRHRGEAPNHPSLIHRSFDPATLAVLDSFKTAWLSLPLRDPETELVWLAITAILRPCASVGTAPWQYILPNKTKKKVLSPFTAYRLQVEMMRSDLAWIQAKAKQSRARFIPGDAKTLGGAIPRKVHAVITSPPYANNYDYADAVRFEMTFWGEVEGWSDLHDKVRKHLMVSSSQHSSREKLSAESILQSPQLQPIRAELAAAVEELAVVREDHGGKKHYHTMIAAYCRDLALVMEQLRRVCRPGARMAWVIGDSAPYGVYCPIDQWVGKLARAAGFDSFRFDKIRDRNIKWKNRKHRVPLKEGILWIEG